MVAFLFRIMLLLALAFLILYPSQTFKFLKPKAQNTIYIYIYLIKYPSFDFNSQVFLEQIVILIFQSVIQVLIVRFLTFLTA